MVSAKRARRRSSSAWASHSWTLRTTAVSGGFIEYPTLAPRRPRDRPRNVAILLELIGRENDDVNGTVQAAQGAVHLHHQGAAVPLHGADHQEVHIAAL